MFIPRRKVRPHRHKPWYSEDLNPLRRAKELAYKRWKSDGFSAQLEMAYKSARKDYNVAVKRQKAQYASEVAMKINGMTGKQWWKEVDRVLGRSAVRGIPPIVHQGSQVMASGEKARIFNRMFAAKSVVADPNADTAPVDRACERSVPAIRFHSRIVAKLLRQVDPAKAPGLDAIPGIVLKFCAKELSYPLARIFQASMNMGIFPWQWKTARISPVFKKGDKTQASNYRPVALLSLLSKIMERYVNFYLQRHLEENNLLEDCQFGFRAGNHTLHPLLILHQTAAQCLDRSQEVSLVALDIAGAFDTVWHSRLLVKCESMGIRGNLLDWLRSYLSNRKQLVAVDGVCSDPEPVCAGVPQGSILGPVLFLLYINDIPAALKSQPLIYADDCTLMQTIVKPVVRREKNEELQADLDSILSWADVNQMKFAAHKTQVMKVSRRRDRNSEESLGLLNMGGTTLERVQKLKLLGVEFDESGSAKQHVANKAATAAKLVGMLRRQSPFLTENARFHIYVSCIRPIMEYCSPIFMNVPSGTLALLDRVQSRAARLFPTVRDKLDSLALRRDVAGLCQLYRIVHQSAPRLVVDSLKVWPLRVSRTTRTSEASLGALEPPKSKTAFHQNSFLPYYINCWNNLSDDVLFADSLDVFKRGAARQLRRKSLDTGQRSGAA